MGINQISLTGRCGKDPVSEVIGQNDTHKATFSLGVGELPRVKGGEWTTNWFICEGFGKTADKIDQKLRKGDLVAVNGKMEVQSWDASDGSGKRYKNVVHINWPDDVVIEPNDKQDGPAPAQNQSVQNQEEQW